MQVAFIRHWIRRVTRVWEGVAIGLVSPDTGPKLRIALCGLDLVALPGVVQRIESELFSMLTRLPYRRAARSLAALSCLVSSSTALADTAGVAAALDPMVVSGARVTQPLSDVLPAVTVITREDISASQSPDVLQLIAQAPGVEVAQLGGVGRQAGLFLRGAETRHVLVLIDGIPLNALNFGIAALEHLSPDQVDRIEIVRGNVSALYGSQAVGGVIQIFTRAASSAPLSANASVGAGSQGARSASASVAGQLDRWFYAATLGRSLSDGYDVVDHTLRPGTNPDADGYANTHASLNVGMRPAQGHELGIRAMQSRAVVEYDSEFGPASQRDVSTQRVDGVSLYSHNRISAQWMSNLQVGQTRDRLSADETAYPYFVNTRTRQISWQNDFQLWQDWTVTIAAERLTQDIDSDTDYSASRRTVNSLRAGLSGKHAQHQWQLNARNDDYSDFGQHATWYAGYGYTVAPGWKLTASTSTAFTAPTFNDLFYPWGGNPDLDPERSRAYELGAQWHQGPMSARFVAFNTRSRDLIGYDESFNRANIGRAKVSGAELSTQWALNAWTLKTALTWQSPRNEDTDERLVRRARIFGSLAATHTLGDWEWSTRLRVSGDRLDKASGAPKTLGGYGLIDLSARWNVTPQWSIAARIDNVFDKDWQPAWGYTSAGRTGMVNLEYRGL